MARIICLSTVAANSVPLPGLIFGSEQAVAVAKSQCKSTLGNEATEG